MAALTLVICILTASHSSVCFWKRVDRQPNRPDSVNGPEKSNEVDVLPLPTQPPVVRDLSLVVPGGVTAATIEALLAREGGTLLERLDVLDEYRGAGLPAGTRGVTWRCTFRDPARTLTEREIDALLSRMLKALEEQFGVRRRQATH